MKIIKEGEGGMGGWEGTFFASESLGVGGDSSGWGEGVDLTCLRAKGGKAREVVLMGVWCLCEGMSGNPECNEEGGSGVGRINLASMR